MRGTVWLRYRVQGEVMSDPVRRRMELELERLAQIDGQGFDPDEASLIVEIIGESSPDMECAPLKALWPYARLFLTACLYVAVSDGRYSIEQSRRISWLAVRLGWSAQQLSDLEQHVLDKLEARGRSLMVAI